MNVLMMKARLVLRILIGDVTSDNDEVDKHVEITSTFQEPPFFLKRSFNSFFFCPEKKKKKKKRASEGFSIFPPKTLRVSEREKASYRCNLVHPS